MPPASEMIPPEEVRAALDCLYANVALGQCRLAALLPSVAPLSAVQDRAEALRRLLLAGIEMLQPPRRERFGSRSARSFEVLNLRYVEGLSIVQVADELSVVERQVYRDLRQAYEDLARVLAPAPDTTSCIEAAPRTATPSEGGSLQAELAHLVARPLRLDPSDVLRASLQAVQPLASSLNVRLDADPVPSAARVSADAGILKQVLTQALSLAVQSTSAVSARVAASAARDRVSIQISFSADRQPPRFEAVEALSQLAAAQHLHLMCTPAGGDHFSITISMPAIEPRALLVIEDNPGAIELYQRFLAGSDEWRVVGVSDPRLSYDMALRLRPSAIVLDVMMPQQDGWTVLQLLRAQPETAETPIVICSVFDDPALATALGADACLKKPLSQAEFLAMLSRLSAPRPHAKAGSEDGRQPLGGVVGTDDAEGGFQ